MEEGKTETSKMEWEATEAKRTKLDSDELTEDERKLLKTLDLKSVFVTGANRGLGLEFVRQLCQLPTPPSVVFATYRENDSVVALTEIKEAYKATTNLHLLKMDVTNIQDVKEARVVVEGELKDAGLTLLINNAGVAEVLYFPQITEKNMNHHFDVNTIGPIMVMQELLPLLKQSATRMQGKLSASRSAVLNICAWGASIKRTGVENLHDLSVASCKMSKAALNMAMRIAAHQVKEDGILVIMMCPGWVRTDMGTALASLSTEESIQRILATLANLSDDHQGMFMNRFGAPYEF